MALELCGVSHTYAAGTPYETVALRGVDLTVPDTGVTVVVGSSGSGKSTLLLVAAGLLDPTAGLATVDGTPVARRVSPEARRIGVVFQRPEAQLFAESVLADVAFGPRNQGLGSGEAEQAARVALADVGLDAGEFAERSPFTLSGGESRRVAIAGVLAMRPAYLLLDEPTAGLDAAGRGTITSLIASLGTHAGVVVVTHDPDTFVGLADRFVVLEAGRAIFDGPAAAYCADAVSLVERGVPIPEVIRAQVLASRHATLGGPVTIDVRQAAWMLAKMAGVTS